MLQDCIPVDVVQCKEFLTLESSTIFTRAQVFIAMDWMDGLLTSVISCVPLYMLHLKLVVGVGIWLILNASKKHGKGAYAWVIATDTDMLCHNTGIVYAVVNNMTSYRAEAFGVLSSVMFFRWLFGECDCLFKAHLKIHCDNISVVNSAGLASKTKTDVDVLSQLWFELEEMKEFLTIEFVHIKGHQTLTLFSSRDAVLNH